MEIYVVTSGIYSEYHIAAMFSSRKKAEEFIELFKDSSTPCEIEIFQLDPPIVSWVRSGIGRWRVEMHRDGTVERVYEEALNTWDVAEPTKGSVWKRGKDKPDLFLIWVWARDEKAAIKIANEHRVISIAMKQWEN